MRMTEEEYQQFQERRKAALQPTEKPTEDIPSSPEKDLQSKCEDYLRKLGLFFFHDRSRGDNVPGLPDLVIALWGGRTLWAELKSKSGATRKEQQRTLSRLLWLGHDAKIIRSYRDFVKTISDYRRDQDGNTAVPD